MSFQASLEHTETETRQRLNKQLEKQEREISQLQKKLEHEVEQRHLLGRNQEVSQKYLFLFQLLNVVNLCLCCSTDKSAFSHVWLKLCTKLNKKVNIYTLLLTSNS